MTKNTILLGIDPGYDRLGWAVGESGAGGSITIIGYGCIRTEKRNSLFERYNEIRLQLDVLIEQYKPTSAAIESLFFAKNQKTAMQLSEARGIIISCVLRVGCQVAEYTPLQIKQAVTGFGRADKAAVDKMVRLQLRLAESKILDDTMDALAILLTHSTQLKLQRQLQ